MRNVRGGSWLDRTEKRRFSMARVINCECGYVARGETDDELVADAEQHMQSVHPDLVGKMSRDDILGMAEEA